LSTNIFNCVIDGESRHELNLQDILNYAYCQKYYKVAKVQKNPSEKANQTLLGIFYDYFYSLKNETVNHDVLKFCKTRWGQRWIKEHRASEIMTEDGQFRLFNAHKLKQKQGIEIIYKFADFIENGPKQTPIIINQQYKIPIGTDISLVGKWQYIRETDNGIEILKIIPSFNRLNVNASMQADLELIAGYLAFTKIFNQNDVSLLIVNLYKNQILEVTRKEKLLKEFIKTVKDVNFCIQNDICITSRDIKCFTCDFKNICINN
jgi:CRISPR/Cas system-associated exonuclease Cas4 (RecB family)